MRPGRWTLHACSGCGTAYLNPRPSAASIGKAYASYYTHSEAENKAPAQNLPSWGRALLKCARATFNSYLNARWHTALTPSNAWGRYLVPRISQARALAEQKMRQMPNQPVGRPGRLLDVGCGNGAFLQMAQAAGWSVQGIDFDPLAVAEARRQGLAVDLGGVDQLAAQAQTYDWITCSHVLEHVHEPHQLLQSLHRLLRPGGTLWLQTPNLDSIGHRTYGPHWVGVDSPRHLTLLTLPSLRRALEKAGFQIKFRRLSLFSAMAFYAASHALRTGEENAMALPRAHIFQLRFLLLAILQSWSLRGAEFHTAVATR